MPEVRKTASVLGVAAASLLLSACAGMLQRLSEVGEPPSLSRIENPVEKRDYRPVSMPMPEPLTAELSPNSLWRPGSRTFFKDQRANDVGDILTVLVDVQSEKAELANSTTNSRAAGESAGVPNLLGLEASLNKILPNSVSPSSLASLKSDSSFAGNGSIKREETVKVKLAAVVLQILPNGNLVIAGKQEMRVNAELRQLAVTGVVRPSDIRSDNTVSWEKIAEARVSYGGRGTVSDVQQPRYGQQVYDIIFPF